jgi:hypothetical protein
MKIRSLLLGSAAIAGLSTAGYAADLGVVTSLDVCDELGLSGLTISSDDNCLQISGNVAFEYDFGDYKIGGAGVHVDHVYQSFFNNTGNNYSVIDNDGFLDSNQGDVDAWLKFVGTADSDFGPASATIKLISEDNHGLSDWTVRIDEAWVGIGDTTMLMAGYKSSIFNKGDDSPLNYLGLFNSSSVNTGVGFATNGADTGGDVIQVVHNLGNGVSIGGGLENLGGKYATPANVAVNTGVQGVLTAVGVLAYAGEGVTAHISGAIDDGNIAGPVPAGKQSWKLHAGFTGAWDPIKVVAAASADDTGWWNVLGSASATFDMFTLAVSGEADNAPGGTEWGVGASASATVTDGVTINLGGRFFNGIVTDVYQVEAAISAAVTETITLTGAVGATDSTADPFAFYGSVGVKWAPGGGFTAGSSIAASSIGGWKWVFTAAKSIK